VKVLQINTGANIGSTGRIAEGIGIELMRQGHESYMAYGRNANPSTSQLIKIGGKWNSIWHAIYSGLFDRHGFTSKIATKKFIRTIEKLKPDIIHLHNIHGYYLHVGYLFNFLRSSKIPVVWTFHDCWPFTGHCTYFDSVGCTKWQTECYHCPKSKAYPTSYFLDQSKRNFLEKKELFQLGNQLHIVAPSQWLANLIQQSFLAGHNIHMIHNGVDISVFKPAAPLSAAPKENVILGVASIWDKRKGLEDFIALRALLPATYKIILVGLSQEQIQQLPAGITGIARTENIQQLAKLYSDAAVFVNPTWQDNFPTTNIEALACGTPVVTYQTGGSPEAIDQHTGAVVAQGDISGLVNAIRQFEKMPNDVAAACRHRAESVFSMTDRFSDYVALYKNILQQQG
jgi:putative colanic acid biosynthesis glycosyltransferase